MHSIQAIKALITDVLVFIITLAATEVHLRDLRAREDEARRSSLICKPVASLTVGAGLCFAKFVL
jgi:3-dehydroquinate dehydratase